MCVCGGGTSHKDSKKAFFMIMVNDNVFFEHVISEGGLNMSLPLLYQQCLEQWQAHTKYFIPVELIV